MPAARHLLEFRSKLASTVLALSLLTVDGTLIAQEEPPKAGSANPPGAKSTADDNKKSTSDVAAQEAEAKAKETLDKYFPFGSKEWKEAMQGTRPKREPPELLTRKKDLFAPKPPRDEETKFNELKRKGDYKPEDLPLIDKVVKYEVYRLAERNLSPALFSKARNEIETTLERPDKPQAAVPDRFLTLYKQLLRKYLPDLLDNHLHLRVNAMMLLAKLRDQELVPLFVKHIRDEEQHEGVKYWAVKGLMYLAQSQQRISKVDAESEAVIALLELHNKNAAVHRMTRQAIVQALGAIGRVTSVAIKKDADVAVALARIVQDPNTRRSDRTEAVLALANLQVPNDLEYNFQYVAHLIAQFAAETADAAVQDPIADDLHSQLYIVQSYESLVGEKKDRFSLAKRAEMAKNMADADYVNKMGVEVKKVAKVALDIYYKGQPKGEEVAKKAKRVKDDIGQLTPYVEALNAYLKSRPPRAPLKVTPEALELGPPPALVGPMAPAENKPDEPNADSASEAAEAKTATSPSGP